MTPLKHLRWMALAALALVCGCGGDYRLALPGGYALARANSMQHSVMDSTGTLVVMPDVVELGRSGDVVFGRTERPADPSLDLGGEPGWFLLRTTDGTVRTGLSREAWLAALREMGVRGNPVTHRPTRTLRL